MNNLSYIPDNPYLLLTPGPLSTAKSVRAALLRDWCTWDEDYLGLVQTLRADLTGLATDREGFTCVLMQGSGTFCVESVIGSVIPEGGRLLVLANGAYGDRMARIATRLRIDVVVHDSGEMQPPDLNLLGQILRTDQRITHVGVIHCETTTGLLNPVQAIGRVVKGHGKVFIVDAMSSFGGIPFDMAEIGADFLVTSANKCLQAVPGFGIVIARREEIEKTWDRARSLSLDLFDQWQAMERQGGKWRFTSPTHAVRALVQALKDLGEEGGVRKRHERYGRNHRVLVEGMIRLGFHPLLPEPLRSPIITSFRNPEESGFEFKRFYNDLKARGFVIYPGKVTSTDTFRVGTIGDVRPDDMKRFVAAVQECRYWRPVPAPWPSSQVSYPL